MYQPTTALRRIANLTKSVRVVQGGQGAGKTISILMLLLNYGMHNQNKEITIVQAELSKLKKTAVRDFKKILLSYDMWDSNRWNKTESIYSLPNGTYFEFIGLDKADVGKGFRRDVVYFNEINKGNITLDTFVQFSSRSVITYADLNPDISFWLHTEIIPDEDSEFITLTFRDNEYLPESEVKQILKYREKGFKVWKGLDQKQLFREENIKSKYWSNKWAVYGLGLVGKLEGAIIENWREGEFIESEKDVFGQDFGFSKDPTTLVRLNINKSKMTIHAKECLYQAKLSTQDIRTVNELHASGFVIYADSAEPRLISELNLSQDVTISPVVKGAGSILEGLKLIQDYELIVDPDSLNLIQELNEYRWAINKVQPIDAWNHLIDALRYGVTSYLRNPNEGEYYF